MLELVAGGKRVVVSSSTKAFAVAVAEAMERHHPNKRVGCFVGGGTTEHEDEGATCGDVAGWSELDVLVYSPTITAGVSFEAEHFDSQVGFLLNSRFTPSVDVVLQQLFRVRRLKDGDMHLFVVDTGAGEGIPVLSEEVDRFLQEEELQLPNASMRLSFYAEQRVEDGELKYDTERLSYLIIKGIHIIRNRSLVFCSSILENTLSQDYNIPCETRALSFGASDPVLALDLQEIGSKVMLGSEFPGSLISDEEYERLVNQPALAAADRVNVKAYAVVRESWGIDGDIDKCFWDEHVAVKDPYEKTLSARRFKLAVRAAMADKYEFDPIMAGYARKVQAIKASQDSNLALHNSRAIMYYTKLVYATCMFVEVLRENIECALRFEAFTIQESALERCLQECDPAISRQTDVRDIVQEYKRCLKIDRLGSTWLKYRKVLSDAFGMTMSRNNPRRGRDGHGTFTVRMDEYKQLWERYHPKVLDMSRVYTFAMGFGEEL